MLCALCILSMPFSLICIIDLGIPSPAVYLFAPTWIVNGWTFLPFIPFFPILFFSFALALPFPLFIYYFNFPNLAEQLSCIYHIVTIDIRILYLIHRLYCYNYVYNSYTFYPVNPISAPYRLQLIGVLSFIIQFSVRIHTYCILSQFDTLAHFVIFTHSDRDRKCKQRKKNVLLSAINKFDVSICLCLSAYHSLPRWKLWVTIACTHTAHTIWIRMPHICSAVIFSRSNIVFDA